MKQHTKPCKGCPWTKTSARGWLGAATPVEFLQTSEAEHRMPCHNRVAYDRPDWETAAAAAPQCAGRAVHFANRCKKARNPELMVATADYANVFSNPQDFIDHHTPKGAPPRIMILGHTVITVD